MRSNIKAFALAIAAATLAAPAGAAPYAVAEQGAEAEDAAFARDRADILAMAGDYKVRFDMQEATAWMEGYEPLDRKISGGHEVVRVIEDTGDRIVLQHLLVIEHEGKTHIIKHWRQDWEYEPEAVLVYAGKDRWVLEEVPEEMREGAWSQTVYQVDDSPRYGGWGRFETQDGVRRWVSNMTWRPLARRDAIRDPVYDRYHAINRHQWTHDGWIHWQDNMKMRATEKGVEPIVQEYVLNTYTKFADYDVAAADAYWAATADYWKAVREAWDGVLSAHNAIAIEEEAETGTVISARLLEMGTELAEGELEEEAAIAEARRLIAEATAGTRPAQMAGRE
ncbi:MAG: DUF6607 family protein [Sphingomonadaceae bacterium]